MIYLIGGAPRAGKSILCQQVASKLNIGWVSTDLVMHLLKVRSDYGMKTEWNAYPDAIRSAAENFFPYLKCFGFPYIDMTGDFSSRLQEAEARLIEVD